jgi:RNA polymerase primary sigma factor
MNTGDSDETLLIETLENSCSPNPFIEAIHSELKEKLLALFKILTTKEKEILLKRYGIDYEKPKSLEEQVGKEIFISKESKADRIKSNEKTQKTVRSQRA